MFLSQMDADKVTWLVGDCLLSVVRGLRNVETEDEQVLATFDRLAKIAQDRQEHIISIAIEEDDLEVSPRLAALFLMGWIVNWFSGGRDAISFFSSLIDLLWPEVVAPEGGQEAQIVASSLQALDGLAAIEKPEDLQGNAANSAATGLLSLSRQLNRAEEFDDALACALSATNITNLLDPQTRLAAIDQALQYVPAARESAIYKQIPALLFNRAMLLVELAQSDDSWRLAAFDACQNALRRLPTDEEQRRIVLAKLNAALDGAAYLRPLKTLHLVAQLSSVSQLPESLSSKLLQASLSPIWEGNLEPHELLDYFMYLNGWSIELENGRVALEPTSLADRPTAAWPSWTIDHPALRRAVPDGLSLLREEDLDNILLTLHHEITHIYSMLGWVGIASLALRWALCELEFNLWTIRDGELIEEFDTDAYLAAGGVSPLKELNVILLSEAEQVAEVERKIQILENCWAPWFEGIAVYGELADDATLDPEAYSFTTSVIYNLIDKNPAELAEEQGISVAEVIQRESAVAEALYAQAIKNQSSYRMLSYLGGYHQEYLAGYLAVRSVVASWRSNLGWPLIGTQAFRLLLYFTRYATLEAIPDLGLPADQFQSAVMERHIAWIESIANAMPADLERFRTSLTGSIQQGYWSGGRVQEFPADTDIYKWQAGIIEEFGRQAKSSLRGERALPERVPGADEDLQMLLSVMAQLLEKQQYHPRLLEGSGINIVLNRQLILPFGRVNGLFWLHPQERRLTVQLRTSENSRELGKPGFNLHSIPLSEEELEALEPLVRRGASDRMTISRVVDLADMTLAPEGGWEGGNGMNLMVYQYGDWLKTRVVGAVMGKEDSSASQRENIRNRLIPHEMLHVFENINNSSHPCARRTRDWLAPLTEGQVQIGSDVYDVSQWKAYVKQLAEQVLSGWSGEDRREIGKQLLELVLTDSGVAAEIAANGLGVLTGPDPTMIAKLIRALDESARRPLTDETIEPLRADMGDSLGILFKKHPYGWDVARL